MYNKIKNTLLLIFFIPFAVAFSQNIQVSGVYYGKNIFVSNPSIGNGGFCIDSILINQAISNFALPSNAIEIDFSLLNIQPQTAVEIALYHKKGCKPKIENPDAIKPHSIFSIESPKVNKNHVLTWKISGKPPIDSIIIEQYKWKRWVVVGKLPNNLDSPEYSFQISPHSGANLFRVCLASVCSVAAKYNSVVKPLTILENKPAHLLFSGETFFELFDNKGKQLLSGDGKELNWQNLPKGEYWINYDNKSEKVVKNK